MADKPTIDTADLPGRLRALPGLEQLQTAIAGFPAYLVGGGVRDLLLGESHPDLDVVIEGDVAPVALALGGELTEHERFQTAKVRLGELTVDLARARAETYAHPGALPDITPAKLEDDLSRRDFTINAMAVPLGREPELIDPHGGADDLAAGHLRVLHKASFRDDPTRALRAARYAARFGFELESETATLLRGADLRTVSDDRIDAELRRLATERDPARGLVLLQEWGVLGMPADAVPLAGEATRLAGRPPWEDIADRPEVLLAALGRGSAGEQVRAAATGLAEATPERPSRAVQAASGRPPVELVLGRAMGAEWLDRYVSEWRDVALEIDGRELIAEGVPEGPDVGKGLEAALSAKLDGEISGRDEEMRIALAAARGEIPED
jgi:tRNA nucleotidyltransferase (CCA-adding enzyme)